MRRSVHLFHPRRARLAAWLDDDDPQGEARLSDHLANCRRCAERLDGLAATSTSPSDDVAGGALAAALRDAMPVPDQLPVRIQRAIDQRVRVEQEFELLLGLVSISKDTAELLLPDERETDRGSSSAGDGDDEPSRDGTPNREEPS